MAEISNIALSLNAVHSVTATSEAEVLSLSINLTDVTGATYDAPYISRPEDTFGLNPIIRQWLADNPDFPVQPYTPPTQEEIRASMAPLSARQLRLGLINNGLTLAQVTDAIEAMPAGPEKDAARIEWEYATTYNRTHPLIASVGGALGLTDEQIDTMWTAAKSL